MSTAPTKKQLAARHKRRLQTMRQKLQDMAREWDDLDEFCVNELSGLAESTYVVSQSLIDDAPAGEPS